MARLPQGYEGRATAPDELEAVTAVLVADDLADIGEPHFDAGFLQEEWSRHRIDLASDTWVVTAPGGSIVGYAQSVHEVPGTVESWGVVHYA
jgi:mycothiol synthase